MKRRVVVTGIGVLTPIGIGEEAFWEGLKTGKSGGAAISNFDTSQFSTKFACQIGDFHPEAFLDPKQARRLDRFLQFA
ncbi:MAG TPA: beta-ketoacyl synthase N-terminal-like domain-containing protein, partial [bacterium]|nr:beta-ketoacyl synthase N-terminal-like domain-containing protein [bacterium]